MQQWRFFLSPTLSYFKLNLVSDMHQLKQIYSSVHVPKALSLLWQLPYRIPVC